MSVHIVKLSDLAKELATLRSLKEDVEDGRKTEEEGWYDEDRLAALEDLEDKLRQHTLEEAAEFEDAMIPETDWEEFCQNEAEELGYIDEDSPLSIHVDWSGWAEAVKEGYEQLDFDSETYYRRVH